MRNVKIKYDIHIMGYGVLHKGGIFEVEKYNSRFVYIRLCMCEFRLPAKAVEVVKPQRKMRGNEQT